MATSLTDGSGYLWDFNNDGSVNNGTSDAFDGGLVLTISDGASSASFNSTSNYQEDSGREQVYVGSSAISGLEVTRKTYVPDSGLGYARFSEYFTNTTESTITRTITITTNLGSDYGTRVLQTSSGDATFSSSDNWIITDDGSDGSGDPAVLHYFCTDAGLLQPSAVNLSGDMLSYSFVLTINPGETKSIVHFSAQSQSLTDLQNLAGTLTSAPMTFLSPGMTQTELSEIQNFATVLYSSTSVTSLPAQYTDLNLTGTASINGTGNAYNNKITGNSADNTLSGVGGNDTLNGGAGNDVLNGGTGVDTASYEGAASAVKVSLAPTVQQNTVGAGLDTLVGIENLTGSSYNDTLTGNSGANVLNGGAGNDVLRGGLGNDIINGGAGSDTATYSEFSANLTVDLNKTIAQNTGAGGSDTLIDIENIIGSASGINTLTGNDGANSLTGGSNNDVIKGGLGSDTLKGNAGNDVLYGESIAVRGNLIRLDEASFNVSASKITFDNTGATNPSYTVSVAGVGNVTVSTGGWFLGQAGGALNGTSTITLTDHTPTAGSMLTLDTNASNTYISTDSSTPTSPILSGSPKFNGPISVRFSSAVSGVGLTGGYFDATNGTSIEAFDVNGNSLGLVTNTQTGQEFFGLAMSNGDRKIAGISFYITGSEPAGFGIDNLTFGSATVINELLDTNDKLYGGTGDDKLYGGAGNDLLDGGADNDYIRGDDGIDTATYASATSAVTVTLATTAQQNTVGAGLDTLVGIENLTGSGYNDNLTGNSSANVLNGGAGNDVLNGGTGVDTASYEGAASAVTVSLATIVQQNTVGAGLDTLVGIENLTGSSYNDTLTGNSVANILRGGSGNDTLTGGSGADTFYGDAGNDLLRGGTGNDTLYGGAGQDLFRFDSTLGTSNITNIDQLKDFVVADDTIQLENSIFTKFGTTTTGAINSAYLKANTTGLAADSNDYIVYETDTGKLFYDADGSGAGLSVQIATLGTNLALTSADFVLV